jgi:hypothetical protein
MKSKQITLNSVKITVHSDGSITKPYYGTTKRTFGGDKGKGYLSVRVGSKKYLVHRVIALAFLDDFHNLPDVDHIDNDGTNNDLSNLRMATHLDNCNAGRRKRNGCSSQYVGVCFPKGGKKWQAACGINGKFKYLGYFDDEHEAAVARDAYAFSQGSPLEGLNFPENYA